MPIHVVVAGEHLARIATRYGFADPKVIWDRVENQALQQSGRTPTTLLPGDNVFIPERTNRVLHAGTNTRQRAVVKTSSSMLRLVFQAYGGKPVKNAHGNFTVGDLVSPVSTDGNGQWEMPLPPDTEAGVLLLEGDATTLHAIDIPFHVGHLDPVTAVSGQENRLNNLGYRAGVAGGADAPAFRSAVEEFQCDEHLQVDGVCGTRTQARLRLVHGC